MFLTRSARVERPPYNPSLLAEMRGIKLLPTDRVVDARTYSDDGQHFAIEYIRNGCRKDALFHRA